MPIGCIPVGDYVADESLAREPYLPINEFAPVCDSVLERTPLHGPAFPILDSHVHFGRLCLGEDYESLYDTGYLISRMQAHGVKRAINMDAEFGAAFDRMRRKLEGYEDFVINFGTVDVARFAEPDFEREVYRTVRHLTENGVRGLKIWKNIGLGLREADGRYLRLDDPRLDCIWKTAAAFQLPVTVHVADPPQFFKPIDCRNERYEELKAHPEWGFTRPGMPSFAELMEMFETVVARNPETTIIGAHVVCPEDLGMVGRWLDRYENLHVDIADRLNELGRHPYSTRRFMERYQDRILFATDTFWPNQELYDIYYRFLETYDEYFDYNLEPGSKGRWCIYGIGLERDVLEKIYNKNALQLLQLPPDALTDRTAGDSK